MLAILYSDLMGGGSSLTAKKMGQILVVEDLNSATPSVLKRKETFAG